MPISFLGSVIAVIAIFFLGYITLHTLLELAAARRKRSAAQPPAVLSDLGIERISITGGLLLLGLAVLLLFTAPSQYAVGTWIVLTVLGFLAGLIYLATWGRNSASQPRDAHTSANPTPAEQTRLPRSRANGGQSDGAQSLSRPEPTVIVTCANCAQKLRIPKRATQLIITCPKCRHSFPYGGSEDTLREK